jgi:hypothetical protein
MMKGRGGPSTGKWTGCGPKTNVREYTSPPGKAEHDLPGYAPDLSLNQFVWVTSLAGKQSARAAETRNRIDQQLRDMQKNRACSIILQRLLPISDC